MPTDDFLYARLDQMFDLHHPLAVLANRLPWSQVEAALAPAFERKDRQGEVVEINGLLDTTLVIAGGSMSAAGRPRLPSVDSFLAVSEACIQSQRRRTVSRWSENVVWQYFSGQEYYTPGLPCDATQIGRFRSVIGEADVEILMKATIDTAVQTKAIKPAEFKRVIVDTTVQEKAIAHPVDSRLLEIARSKIIHRGKYKSLTKPQRRWLRRRQAVEPAIGHLQSDHRMDRCWLQGKLGDVLHAVMCAIGYYNLRWLMRAALHLRPKDVLLRFVMLRLTNLFWKKTTIYLQSLFVYKTTTMVKWILQD